MRCTGHRPGAAAAMRAANTPLSIHFGWDSTLWEQRLKSESTAPVQLPALKPSMRNSRGQWSPSALVLWLFYRKSGGCVKILSGCVESSFHQSPFRNVACGSLRCAGNSRAASNMIWVRLHSSAARKAKFLPSLTGCDVRANSMVSSWKLVVEPAAAPVIFSPGRSTGVREGPHTHQVRAVESRNVRPTNITSS